ncbi:ABC transporter permease [Clostridium sp. CCUG 7971]|uniref:ABC transporter permease n=1 Tax=Clostridium sp. CCUG 7971 TaxID=2811414 RepID=UPI001ABADE93|nr:ABC transporter permease [Clostridium sp. CCUG 7971]MBO3442947.1 ABC transporter permease [Clostridium sp. CCUG 7971]
MNLYTSLTLRYLRENKKRTIVTIIGIILSTALICGIGNIYASLMDYEMKSTVKRAGDFHATFYDIKKENLDYITKSSEVEKSGFSSELGYSKINKSTNNLLEVKAFDKNVFNGFQIKLKEGKLPTNNSEIVLSEKALVALDNKYKVGDKITLSIGDRFDSKGKKLTGYWISEGEYIKNPKEREFRIVGIIENPGFESGNLVSCAITYLDINKLEKNTPINLSININNPKEVYEIVPKIAENSNFKLEKNEWGDYKNLIYNEHLLRLLGASQFENINNGVSQIVLMVSALVIICTVATVYNSFSISIGERKKQFGILNSIGATSNQIMKIVFAEGLIVSIIAIPIGLAAGTLAIDLVFKIINGLFTQSFIADLGLKVVYNPKVIILSAIVVLITIFISAILPAINAAKVSPLDAIKNTSEYKIGKVKNSKLIKLIFKTEGVLAYKNLRRNKKKFRITLFSLIISVVIFVTFSGYMKIMMKADSIRLGQMTYDILIESNDSPNKIDNDIIDEIKNIKGIKDFSVIPRWNYGDITLNINEKNINNDNKGLVESMYSKVKKSNDYVYEFINSEIISPGDTAISNLKLKQGSFDKESAIAENGVILLNTSYQESKGKKSELNLTNYKVGDTIKGYRLYYNEEAQEEIKEEFEVKIMAITDDLVTGRNEYKSTGLDLITYDEVSKNIGYEPKKNAIFIESDGVKNTKDAIKEIAKKYRYSVQDSTEEALKMKQNYMAMQIFVYGFVSVISLVSITNIVNTISTNINLRKRELAIISSIGVTPQGFNKMIYLESFLYGTLSLIYGIPIGIGLITIMNNTISEVIEFNLILPWEAIGICIIATFIITFIASYIPMKKINKENIIENIRQESI